MDNLKIYRLGTDNRREFIQQLETELCFTFGVNIKDLPENYGYKQTWSLLNMIIAGTIDSYQLIYVNDKFWSGSGGMLREFNLSRIYQAAFRAFANAKAINTGLGCKSYSHEFNTRYQIERAKLLNCDSVIISFNKDKERLFTATGRYHLSKVFGKDAFIPSEAPVRFNGVEQWLLTMSLK
jgi:hypothetical protein